MKLCQHQSKEREAGLDWNQTSSKFLKKLDKLFVHARETKLRSLNPTQLPKILLNIILV